MIAEAVKHKLFEQRTAVGVLIILFLFSLLPTFSAKTGGKDLIVAAKSHSFSYFPSHTIIH